jgi:hypothetical protein
MQQVADWLEKLGLGQYAQRFAENDISFSILPELSDQDLEKIGVASLGHRRLLLREIANLGKTVDATAAAPSPTSPSVTAASAVTPPAEAAGERRHVTVMFCDLVDTGLIYFCATSRISRRCAHRCRTLSSAYRPGSHKTPEAWARLSSGQQA